MAEKKIALVEALDLDAVLGKPKNRIARVGIELEGGWDQLHDTIAIEHDGSVFKDPKTEQRKLPAGCKQAGEISLGPMMPAYLQTAIKKYYPPFVDKTCGLHVHMSFEDVFKYSTLMVPEYQETIIKYLTLWAKGELFDAEHCIWERLDGGSTFCQKKFWPDEQVKSRKDHDQLRHGHRYTIINYCYHSHGTVECRVLPMMKTPDQAYRAVRRVLDITNACLTVLPKRDRIREELIMPQNDVYEEYIEEIL